MVAERLIPYSVRFVNSSGMAYVLSIADFIYWFLRQATTVKDEIYMQEP